VWQNIFAALEKGGMKPSDLVKTVSYLTREEDIPAFVKVRAKYLGDIRPAQMLLLTPGFLDSGFLVEVEAYAAAP
jgi:enamine deaminase RidA (YjgF/YER057c/UK114 family)